jgi:transketolase N-terminal domain/subunit
MSKNKKERDINTQKGLLPKSELSKLANERNKLTSHPSILTGFSYREMTI